MKRCALIWLLMAFVSLQGAMAQINTTTRRDAYGNQIDPSRQPDNLTDSTKEVISLAPKLYMWRISEDLGQEQRIAVDTVALNFQNDNFTEGMTGHYNMLGNLGSPRLSRIFSDRQHDTAPTLFLQPYSAFFVRPDQMLFTNSNVPYTNLTYFKSGDKTMGDDRFKAYFSVNANKRLAFGFKFDYLYARGRYDNQSTSHFNAGVFASYMGKHYQMHAVYNNFYLKQNENGGIADDRYITRPEDMAAGSKTYKSNEIPVNLESTSNRNHDFYVYLTHRYRLGFTRDVQKIVDNEESLEARRRIERRGIATDTIPVKQDTLTVKEFVPVTSFIHTVKLERSRHNFHSQDESSGFFPTTGALSSKLSNDSTVALSVKNVFGISLLEGFNKYAKAGLTAYISHKYSRYTLMNMDTLTTLRGNDTYGEHEVFVGGELAKRAGQTVHYNVTGEFGLAGVASGQYSISGNADMNLPLLGDTLRIYGRAYIKNTLPSFYMRHYHSNHYTWDFDDMDKELRTRVEGELDFPKTGTNIRVGVETIKNYTYFNGYSTPQQASDNIKVAEAALKQNFRLGIFHLDNEVIWQKTSNKDVLPLPTLSLYHNLYLLTKLAKKVLTVQLGADVRYFSKYYAPAYSPAIQQFRVQNADEQIEIGGYPIVNVYANLQLKRTRFFVMMSHVNSNMGSRNYFLSPHYPINPSCFRFGVSWNFYD